MTERLSIDPDPDQHAALGHAQNAFAAQGRTVDTAHLVAAEHMTQNLLYTGMIRGAVPDVTAAPEAGDPEPEAGL
jgi:hypothetical protein